MIDSHEIQVCKTMMLNILAVMTTSVSTMKLLDKTAGMHIADQINKVEHDIVEMYSQLEKRKNDE